MVSRAQRQTSPAAMEAIQNRAGSPMWTGYRVAIPEGWQAVWPVFYRVPDAPDEPAQPGIPAALLKGAARFRAGLLLCRPGTDGRAILQEFAGDALPEGAFLGQDGRYLQASQGRPTYAVVPLAAPSPTSTDQSGAAECVVLVPLVDVTSGTVRDSLPPLMMFVNGQLVQPLSPIPAPPPPGVGCLPGVRAQSVRPPEFSPNMKGL